MNLQLSVACFLAMFAIPSVAQNNIETMQVTGSRIIDSNQASFTALNRDQIDQINPVSTLDLLRRIPNLVVAENGVGGLSFVSLRGGESNFTLIMIDGIAVNDSTNSRGGGFDFSQINPEAIESIEVSRGGISAIYGGEAISGVIHIITRNNASQSVGIEIGTDELFNANLMLAKNFDNGVNLLASLSTRQRQQSTSAKAQSQQGLFKLGYQSDFSKHAFLVTLSDSDNTSFAEDSGGMLFADPRTPEYRNSQQWLVGLNSEFQLDEQLQLHSKLSWLNREESSVHPGINQGVLSGIPASDIVSEFERKEIEVYTDYALNQNINLITGLTLRSAEGSNDGTLDFGFPLPVDYVLKQDTRSAFAEAQYRQSSYALNLGWRYDDSDDFDSETSLRVAANYFANDQVTLFAVYNEGYKLPSFFALAHPLVGNPQLLPERSENIEIGMAYSENGQELTVTFFDNHFTDLVDFDAQLFTNVNRSRVDSAGLELSFVSELQSWLNLSADISYVEVNLNDGVSQLRRRPQWFGSASLDAHWQRLSVTLFMDFRDRYLDSSIPTGLIELGGYAKYGLAASWQVSQAMIATFNIDNFLAREYQESVGFVNDEANLRVGLQYQF
ncbi:TonB-dependent receptor plug domain-containing protein [Aliiglaciecola litoralis]|uniref:TonB-dependent receptor n=1 Tax=Aliiglaciecola litoralis TaxID=582857 RepID=A0ABN1LFN6_9ALTE